MKARLTDRVTVRWIAGGAAAVLVAAGGLAFLLTGDDAPHNAATATVRVQRGTVSTTVSAAGTVQPLQSRGLNFSVSGTVTELTVQPGDTVQVGTVLARIDDTDVRSAVTAAQTQVENAEEAVARASSSSSQSAAGGAGSGSTACAQAAAFRLPGAPVVAVKATSASPAATASSPAATPSSTPATPPATAPTGAPHTTTTRPSGCQTGTTGTGDTGGAGGGSRGGTTDSLFAAQQQLNNAIHTLNQQQAKLEGTVITAPVAGRVLSVGGVIGSAESPSSGGFIVLAGTDDVAVQAQFTEAEVPKLALGQPVRITLPNLPDQEFTGTVTQIDPAGTISNQLVRYAAVIAFDAVPGTLLFGQTANVAVVTASATGVLSVPTTAVTGRDGSRARVSVRTAAGATERRTVEIGLLGDVNVEIKAGLTEGEEVYSVAR